MVKKIMICFLTVIMIIADLTFLCIAQEDVINMVYGESMSVKRGDRISVPIKLDNNNGLMGFKIIIEYNENDFDAVRIERGDVIPNGLINDSIGVTPKGEFYVVWSDNNNTYSDGVLFYVVFDVLSSSDQNSEINISYSQDDTFNEAWEDVELNCFNVDLSISGSCEGNPDIPDNPSPSENTTTIYSDRIFAEKGSTVSIPVYIKNNNGIMGCKLFFNYNEDRFTPKSVTSADGINGILDNNIGLNEGSFSVVWNSTENYLNDGLLFMIELEVLSEESDRIVVSYSSDDTFNENWEDVELQCESIEINNKLIFAEDQSQIVIDYSNSYIFGLPTSLNSVEGYIKSAEGYEYSLVYDNKFIGTDSKLMVTDIEGNVLEEFTFIIYGDVDGDGEANGMDSVIVSCIVSEMLQNDDKSTVQCLAADFDNNGIVDNEDVQLLIYAGVNVNS